MERVQALVLMRAEAIEGLGTLAGLPPYLATVLRDQQADLERLTNRQMLILGQALKGSQQARANLASFRQIMKSERSSKLNRRT